MEEANRSARRYHGQELKRTVLDECQAGASVASVAMAHGLNANLVHKWRRREQSNVVASVTPTPPAQTFIPVVIAPPVASPPTCAEPREVRIELRRGAIVATVNWPMSGAAECAGWLREVLR
jgi:transposase